MVRTQRILEMEQPLKVAREIVSADVQTLATFHAKFAVENGKDVARRVAEDEVQRVRRRRVEEVAREEGVDAGEKRVDLEFFEQ